MIEGDGNGNSRYEFSSGGELVSVEADGIELTCIATDESGNSASATVSPEYPGCNNQGGGEDDEDDIVSGKTSNKSRTLSRNLTVSPNLASTMVRVSMGDIDLVDAELVVYDYKGKVVVRQKLK